MPKIQDMTYPFSILKPFPLHVLFATLALLLTVFSLGAVLRFTAQDGHSSCWRAISHAETHGLGGSPQTEVPEVISRISPLLMCFKVTPLDLRDLYALC